LVKQVVEGVMELGDVIGNVVGKIAVLGLAPNILDGIEFRSIRWQPRDFEPRATGPSEPANG